MARQPIKLMCVSEVNNNKFYNMTDNGDGTFTAEYGRVGGHTARRVYDILAWDRKYREKTRVKRNKAHYTDITQLALEAIQSVKTQANFSGVSDPEVRNLINRLQGFSNRAISNTYYVTSEVVTEAMVKEAQGILEELARLTQAGRITLNRANAMLLDLYHVIPRQMAQVNDHLVQLDDHLDRHGKIQGIIQEEQDNVDMMSQQVSVDAVDDDDSDGVLDAMGITIAVAEPADIRAVTAMNEMGASAIGDIYKVINTKTEKDFHAFVNKRPFKDAELLWHGSRNQNWLSILERGLLIRPTGVITTGAMFGNGIYFANCLQKSANYAGEYCALFHVHLGNKLEMPSHDYSLSAIELARRGAYDSVWGSRGHTRSWGGTGRLYNDEFIIYNQAQSTIAYLVKMTNGYW